MSPEHQEADGYGGPGHRDGCMLPSTHGGRCLVLLEDVAAAERTGAGAGADPSKIALAAYRARQRRKTRQ